MLVRSTASDVMFEVFELSPTNEAVYSTPGRLRRYFPDDAVSIPTNTFDEPEFRTTIAHTISTMSHESVAEMQPRAMKAGQSQVEERDTVQPFIVKNLFLAIL